MRIPRLTNRRLPRSRLSGLCGVGITLAEASQEAIVVIDAGACVRLLNPAAEALLGVGLRKAKGRRWHHLFQIQQPLAGHVAISPMARCLQLRQRVRLPAHTILIGAHGVRQRVAGSIVPLDRQDGGGALLMVHLTRFGENPGDELQARVREHEALLSHMFRLNTVGELATGIAHELNQPLSAILSYSQASLRLLHLEEPDLAQASEALLETAAQARRAGQILSQLRAFVSKRMTDVTPVAINQSIINTLTLLAGPLQQGGVQVRLYTEPCPTVFADAIQLEQVLVNLIRNAVEAMQASPAGERVLRVSSRHVEGFVQVDVQDSGPGFSPGVQARLFNRFYSTKAQGMGLGLNISQTIIEAAGGTMEAASPAEGGALFSFRLPARTVADASGSKNSAASH